MSGGNFIFLTVDGTGRPSDSGSRATIRSRCMKGVNIRQDSRRSRKKARKSSARLDSALEYIGNNTIVTHHWETSLNLSPKMHNDSLYRPLLLPISMSIDDIGVDSSQLPSSVLQTGEMALMTCKKELLRSRIDSHEIQQSSALSLSTRTEF